MLLIGDVAWDSVGTDPAQGVCQLAVDGNQVGEIAVVGEVVDVTDDSHLIGQGLNTVSGPLSAGAHSFKLRCLEDDGDIAFHQTWLSVVYIGAA